MKNKVVRKEKDRNREAQLLQIAHLGRPVIREVARPVADISDPFVQKLIDDMIATCNEANGVGIAAPQVFSGLRMFVVAPAGPRYSGNKMKPFAVINPEIVSVSEEMKKDWEGCLSIPGIFGLVPRPVQIKVAYFNREGKRQTKTFSDFVARIFLHEYDHLDGIVFLDRADSADLVTEQEFRRLTAK